MQHAIQSPDAYAVKFQDETLTYHELMLKAARLARYLSENNLAKDKIAIYLNYSPQIIVAVLAAFLLGIVFIPIDPEYPSERIDYILANSKINYLISETNLLLTLAVDNVTTFNIDEIPKNNTNLDDCCNFLSYQADNSPVYILYTSGSTGKPKGVVINQQGLVDAYLDWQDAYNLTATDNHLQMASFSFDVFYGDLIRALCSGATLVLCPRNVLLKPKLLSELLITENITVAEFVPSVLRNLANYMLNKQKYLVAMRLLICGSDNWSIGEYKKFRNICGNATRLINSYGLTEATIDSCYFELTPEFEQNLHDNDSVPIGRPFSKTNIFLLNSQLDPVHKHETGEIYISGSGLALGYHNNTVSTQAKFIQANLNGKVTRLLKTGDLGQYVLNNNIQLVGRIDNQVKLNGRRIEMSDIENNLNLHPSIAGSMVTLRKKENGKRYLAAYIVVDPLQYVIESELRDFLRNNIPCYMIPKTFIKIDKLPLTPNGKLDRQYLKN